MTVFASLFFNACTSLSQAACSSFWADASSARAAAPHPATSRAASSPVQRAFIGSSLPRRPRGGPHPYATSPPRIPSLPSGAGGLPLDREGDGVVGAHDDRAAAGGDDRA